MSLQCKNCGHRITYYDPAEFDERNGWEHCNTRDGEASAPECQTVLSRWKPAERDYYEYKLCGCEKPVPTH